MSRKDTVWGHRHKKSREEVLRIKDEYSKKLGIKITMLEADAIASARSREIFWTEQKLREYLMRLRGLK